MDFRCILAKFGTFSRGLRRFKATIAIQRVSQKFLGVFRVIRSFSDGNSIVRKLLAKWRDRQAIESGEVQGFLMGVRVDRTAKLKFAGSRLPLDGPRSDQRGHCIESILLRRRACGCGRKLKLWGCASVRVLVRPCHIPDSNCCAIVIPISASH
jgi:hypothetical protein